MLLLLVPLTFVAIYANLVLGSSGRLGRHFLRTTLIMGALIVLSNVLFSLLRCLTTWSLAVFWALALLASLAWLVFRRRKGAAWPAMPKPGPLGKVEILLSAVIGLYLSVTLLVAILAPVQTYDSLTYHMSRVAHWAQNQSVAIYATGIERQVDMGPFAEYAVLHYYLLPRTDLFVNLPDWFAYAACLVVVAVIAGQLGADRRGRLFAALFACTIPMMIAQASSTMTDIVVGYWILCMLSEILELFSDPGSRSGWIHLGLAIGLAVLTKATAAAFILPFILWLGIVILGKRRLGQAILPGLLGILVALMVNAYPWVQNLQTYGNPLGSPDRIAYHANEFISPAVLVSNTVRNAAIHFPSNNDQFRLFVVKVVVKIHLWIGLDLNDPRTTLSEYTLPTMRPGLNEDSVGNPFHFVLVGLLFLAALIFGPPCLRETMLLIILSYLLFSIGSKAQVFSIRLQTPFFLLAAPAFGLFFRRWQVGIKMAASVVLVGSSLVVLFCLRPRPVFPLEGRTVPYSILNTPRQDLYFVNAASRSALLPVVETIQKSSCQDIGLMLGGDDAEYLWWIMLDAPWNRMRLEWVVSGTPSSRYTDPGFHPCAVICTSCPEEWSEASGNPLVLDTGPVRLFLSQQP
jgi:hypothetical protein